MNRNQHIILSSAFTLALAIVPVGCGSDDDSSSTTIGTQAATVPSGATAGTGGAASSALPTPETAGPLVAGLAEVDAQAAVEAAGWRFRVVERDGEELVVTADFLENRVNVAVEGGTVTAVKNIG